MYKNVLSGLIQAKKVINWNPERLKYQRKVL